MNEVHSRLARSFSIFLILSLAFISPSASQEPARRAGWAELSAVPPGTAVVVSLADGRRLERNFAVTTSDELVTLDLTAVSSSNRRNEVLNLLRAAPEKTLGAMIYVEESGRRIAVVQRFERAEIVAVERPRPSVFEVPKVVSWVLNTTGPCPNCDANQTWAGRKETPLPSPLPARHAQEGTAGGVLYLAPTAAPNPLDQMTWEQVRLLIPAGLRR